MMGRGGIRFDCLVCGTWSCLGGWLGVLCPVEEDFPEEVAVGSLGVLLTCDIS